MNLCRSCRKDFGSVSAFDAHRVGKHSHDWSEEKPDGRRCLDGEEMAKGWHQDNNGRWRQDVSYEAILRMRQSFSRDAVTG